MMATAPHPRSPIQKLNDEGTILVAEPSTGNERSTKALQPNLLMSQRTLTWTSVKTPATLVSSTLQQSLSGLHRMEHGISFTKITSRGNKTTRVITLSRDKTALFVTHHVVKNERVWNKVPFISRYGMRGIISEDRLRGKYVRYIDVCDINDVVIGVVGTQKLELARTNNRLKGLDSPIDLHRDQIVTLVHHGNETLNMLIKDPEDRKEFVKCVETMRAIYADIKPRVANEPLLLRYVWYDIDLNRDGKVSEKEFGLVLSRINLYVKNPKKVYREFLKQIASGRNVLTYQEVILLLQELKNGSTKSMANQIWDSLFGEKNVVGATEFLTKFFHHAQGETLTTMHDVENLFEQLAALDISQPESTMDSANQINRERFEVFLHHEINDAYDPLALNMDAEVALTEPLPKHWVNTSHNTYLTGDQLQSYSSVEMYVKAMRRGCKCLELDVWDGDKNPSGECLPVVYHGLTLTSKILFVDIIRVVRAYMDKNPETYPIILSLENHCSHGYQYAMAKALQEILGDFLYVPTARDVTGSLPSPEALRGKVVVKGKRPPEPESSDETQDSANDDYDPYASEPSPTGEAAPLPKIVPELARLTLFHGTKFKDFSTSIMEPRSHMHSISETKISKILNKSAANTPMWRLYNIHHMTRTYPAGTRVDSSNYNPLLAWSVGCQLVALNFQTSDAPLILNDGLFRQNGCSGYLRKPESVLGKIFEASTIGPPESIVRKPSEFNPDILDDLMDKFEGLACGDEATSKLIEKMRADEEKTRRELEEKERAKKALDKPIKLKIRVLSGSCLPKPLGQKVGETIDPYVTVTVHDVQRSGKDAKSTYVNQSHVTSSISDNGFCPVWNEEESSELVVHSPQVAMVQFTLMEEDVGLDDRVAEAAIPVRFLRKGYRSIQLHDLNNTRSGPFGVATLLVEIQAYDVAE